MRAKGGWGQIRICLFSISHSLRNINIGIVTDERPLLAISHVVVINGWLSNLLLLGNWREGGRRCNRTLASKCLGIFQIAVNSLDGSTYSVLLLTRQ